MLIVKAKDSLKIAELLIKIETVADNVILRDVEADVIQRKI